MTETQGWVLIVIVGIFFYEVSKFAERFRMIHESVVNLEVSVEHLQNTLNSVESELTAIRISRADVSYAAPEVHAFDLP